MNNSYLIPANTKKSMLIFGLFTKFDLILFGSGIGLSILLLILLPVEQLVMAIVALLPALVTGFLVMPVPNYHNIRTLLMSAFDFYTNQRKFKWKGWCVPHGEDKK
jgi:hypothetical protein